MQGTSHRADVVVVGAGIVGCATAYYLSRRGVKVTVIDAHEPGFRQSSRNFGFVQQFLSQTLGDKEKTELTMMVEAIRIWEGLGAELEADLEWTQKGNLAMTDSLARLEEFRSRYLPLASAFGIRASVAGSSEIATMLPGMRKVAGGFLTYADGHAEPRKVARAFMMAARRLGAVFHRASVTGVLRDGSAVAGILTDLGEVRAAKTVCAAGAWSSRFAQAVGLRVPQRRTRVTVSRTRPLPRITDIAAWVPSLSFRQCRDGSVILGNKHPDVDIDVELLSSIGAFFPSYLEFRKTIDFHIGKRLPQSIAERLPWSHSARNRLSYDLQDDVTAERKKVAMNLQVFRDLFPGIGPVETAESWSGTVDHTPDRKCVIGEHPDVPGFVLATGFSGHGFGMGPIAGRLTAELVAEGRPSIDLAGVSPIRFNPQRSGNRLHSPSAGATGALPLPKR